ncbi:MAG: hypothetical protein CMM01_25360 [Rhodopirellula sp.]|nr:hypothetical protein [Rhodopirellula sp.]
MVIAALITWDGRSLSANPNEVARADYLWLCVATQALCLMLPALAPLYAWAALSKNAQLFVYLRTLVSSYILCIPIVLMLDGMVFGWIGQRLLSPTFARGLGEFTNIIPFFTSGSLILLGSAVAFSVGFPAVAWTLSNQLDKRIRGRWQKPCVIFLSFTYAAAFLFGGFIFLRPEPELINAMQLRSSAHPFVVFRLLPTPSVGPATIPTSPRPNGPSSEATFAALPDMAAAKGYLSRGRRLRNTHAIRPLRHEKPLDVVMLVIESLRPELVANDIMPNLFALAQQSIHCRYHFSGGNATNHGMFSLVTGLEPTWFGTPQQFDPCLNRWFNALGYETGFFAGANDWDDFRMNGFIRPEVFDEFEVRPRNGISSDRRAVELASSFLDRGGDAMSEKMNRRPRLAIVYLYGTHATYQSYPADQLDQPAADDRFPFPYPARMRAAVWNRYRNSARTVDRLIKPLMNRNRVIVAVGDHGEAFLEDGTVGHGLRLSRYQNMTAAVLYCPGASPNIIDQPTSHLDVLPTVLSCLNVQLSDPDAIDGLSLIDANQQRLDKRSFCVRNYLGTDYGLIGPWTRKPGQPFAYRFSASIKTGMARALNGIDERGVDRKLQDAETQSMEIRKWQSRMYRTSPNPMLDPG